MTTVAGNHLKVTSVLPARDLCYRSHVAEAAISIHCFFFLSPLLRVAISSFRIPSLVLVSSVCLFYIFASCTTFKHVVHSVFPSCTSIMSPGRDPRRVIHSSTNIQSINQSITPLVHLPTRPSIHPPIYTSIDHVIRVGKVSHLISLSVVRLDK